jgi:hypothetical protein
MPTSAGASRGLAALLAASLVLGVAFRLVWPSDMEWKADEKVMFEASQRVGVSEPWPWVGMRSGVGVPNPGMSIWAFVGLARVSGARDPVALGRAVMVLNAAALLLLLLFAASVPEPGERPAWLWATALAAVNPGAVQLQRKIWTQSILPAFCLAVLYGWWNRRTRWGAFLWGAIGACVAQIHMAGFFFAAGLAGWTLAFDRRPTGAGPARWGWWILGSAATGWPVIPWASAVLGGGAKGRAAYDWAEAIRPRFWGEWLIHLSGLQTAHSLGRSGFLEWIAEPRVSGTPTYMLAAAVLACCVLDLAVAALAARALWARRGTWRSFIPGAPSTGLLQNAAFLGYGLLLTASGFRVHPHYLIVAYPMFYVWLARAALLSPRGRRMLLALWALHVALSIAFLSWVHVRGGSPGGDYGVAYSRQVKAR